MLMFLVVILRSHPTASDQTIAVTGVRHLTKFSSSAQMTDIAVRIDLQTEAHTTGDIHSGLRDDFGRPPEA